MSSCLGLYIEENLIKYAKVSKNNDKLKVEAFGIKFYDKLSDAIDQIVSETFSYKTPISINLSDEAYNFFYMFSLLKKNNLKQAIETEFESICYSKSLEKNSLEGRYILVKDLENNERIKVIHVSTQKKEISKRIQQLSGKKINSIAPISITIQNMLKTETEENYAIVNMEEKTTITTVIKNDIYDVEVIKDGSLDILEKISKKENSYSKAYEICKNATIYTSESNDIQLLETNNEYLDDIMPTLYTIVEDVKKAINSKPEKINKVYITGTASVINNIDLYFQENLLDTRCEILRPYFIENIGTEVNIKDYIEVNSAISLALQGLGEGNKDINFKKTSVLDNVSFGTKGNFKFKDISLNLKGALDRIEINLLRTCTGFLVFLIIYMIFTGILTNQIKNKRNEADGVLAETQTQIELAQKDIDKLNNKNTTYQNKITRLNKLNENAAEKYRNKDAIPNLLNSIMYVIPKNMKLTSIENTTAKKIVITAESEKYEPLGIFVAKLKLDGILINVVSNESVKDNNIVKVTIEGELP